ncbi:hypothetical protein M9H77_13316 [Catharanthus roseus]|uniref:Uncharacterized protein n=1 Tax=Catharanthus roseus TaxID=4058 RepID=A0ACC0BJT9_CATRO|nr:hypothetical protein M9H77_13316 [Catharanthus roseus]
MKKLYRKGTVHPTPTPTPTPTPPPFISSELQQLLSFLPAAILTLTLALSPQDKQVLAYLISCSSTNFSGNPKNKNNNNNNISSRSGGGADDHPPSFNCYCFWCYMSYWIRWDSSPNRQLIHEIIDAFEDNLLVRQNKKGKGKKERRKGKRFTPELKNTCSEQSCINKEEKIIPNDSESHVEEEGSTTDDVSAAAAAAGGDDNNDHVYAEEEGSDKGSVRRFVSFLGEKIWGVWN